MCCATREVATPSDANASPSWKCNELFTVSYIPSWLNPKLP